jgi:LPS O-antigen subunit length determinant protein (WzzB/FepE family)
VENKNLQYEDEIDLKELVKTLWEKKGFIILFTLSVAVLSVIYVLLASRIYEPKAVVEIGYITKVDNTGVSKRELVDDPQRLVQELNIVFIDALSREEKENKPIIKSIEIPSKKNSQLIEIVAQAESNDLGVKKIKEVISYIKNRHEPIVSGYNEGISLKIASLKRDIDTIKNKTIKKIDDEITFLKSYKVRELDDKIKILKTDTLKKLDDRIYLLKNGEIKKIQEKIKFLNSVELPTLNKKIASLQEQIKKNESELSDLDKTIRVTAPRDSSLTALNLMEKRSVQSRIDRDKMELLEMEKSRENLLNQVLPQLSRQEYELSSVNLGALERERDKLISVDLANLERDREKHLTMDLQSLLREKKMLEENKIPDIKDQIRSLELSMAAHNAKNSDLVGKIIVPDFPAKPKKKLIVAVAFVTGFILSIFIVFLMDFIKSFKEEGDSQL